MFLWGWPPPPLATGKCLWGGEWGLKGPVSEPSLPLRARTPSHPMTQKSASSQQLPSWY